MDILTKIENKKVKGYLTINKRIIFEGANYHITQRALGRELLFLEESDYLYFLKLLKETAKKFRLDLFCFALLPNHLHLFFRINEKNLSQAMKNILERYADYFNKKYKRKGHVFCGRYRASLCNDEGYFLAVSIYIHLNPYNAGLCRDFRDYRFSSLELYIGKIFRESFVNFKEILLCLDSEVEKAKEKYLEILKENTKTKGITLLDNLSVKTAVKKVLNAVRKIIGENKEEKNLDKMIEEFKRKKRVTNIESRKVRKYIIEQLLANGHSISEILGILSITRSTFYRTIGL